MAINLTKNREKIVAAWNDVLDDKTPTDWALFGYEGQSNDLKVVATGDGGLAELQDDLNSGSIMYAFVRVLDPKTTLNKYVLINWQGEGAPTVRKGTCANHIRDVAKLLTGAHLTVNARTDDEVDPDVIIKKVSAVGSAYSFKEHRPYAEDEVKGPVGTVYSKVIPQKEINSIERDNFWRKEQEEESHRVEMERERRKLEMLKVEEENRAREEKAHNQREQQALPNKVTQSKPIEKPDVNINNLSQSMNNMESHSNPSRSMTQAEIMRQQRNQEARELIGSRVGTAKAIFTQNAASGQMKTSSKISAPAKPVRNSIAQRINTFNNSQQFQQPSIEIENPIAVLSNLSTDESNIIKGTDNNKVDSTELDNALSINNPEQLSSEFNDAKLDHASKEVKDNNLNEQVATEENQFSTIKRSPHLKSSSMESDKSDINDRQEKEDNIDDIPNQAVKKDIVSEDDSIYQNVINDDGLKARALYDYQAADDSEITFDPGDIIIHIDRIDEGWWQGLGPDGTYGLFPANYVELI